MCITLRTDRNKEVRHQYEDLLFFYCLKLLVDNDIFALPIPCLFMALSFYFPLSERSSSYLKQYFLTFLNFFTFSFVSFPAIPCLFLALSFYFPWSERSSVYMKQSSFLIFSSTPCYLIPCFFMALSFDFP